MKIKILQANNGDAILINFYQNSVWRNILIDGGTSKTYRHKNGKGKLVDGDLKNEIDNIEKLGQYIDLLILTHIDDDHVGGLLNWIDSNTNFHLLVKKVWFNSGRTISKYLDQKETLTEELIVYPKEDKYTSVKQGITFENYIDSLGIWEKEIIVSGMEKNLYDLNFKILSPSVRDLEKLSKKWGSKQYEKYTSSDNDYSKPLSDLMNDEEFQEDNEVNNGSSISFILTYKDKNILFLADAHPSRIIESLKKLNIKEESPLIAEFVKVSHHGSKKNTNFELLNLINSKNFVISSNGSIHNLPDKLCLARIINSKPGVNLYFNYPEKVEEIFTMKDLNDFKINISSLEKEEIIIHE